MQVLKQSTTVTIMIGPFLDATDGVTEETALGSMGVELSKNGGAWATRNDATATAHGAEGWYTCELNATDTNTLGILKVKAHASATHLPVWHEFMVMPANVYDGIIAGTDVLQVDVAQYLNAAAPALVSGRYNASVGAMASSVLTAAATNADFIDLIWDEDVTTHSTANSAGKRVNQGLGESGAILDTASNNIIIPVPVVPDSVDLADTATYRIGIKITNALDDLPSTAEITPGTYEIDRKAYGGTTWSSVITATANSETDGLVYFDQAFNAGAGFAAGDSIRVIFRAISVVVGGNTHEVINNPGGLRFYLNIREQPLLASSVPTNFSDLAITAGTGRVTVGTNADKTGYDLNADQSAVTVGTLNTLSAGALSSINGEVVDVMNVDTIAELSGVPPAAPTHRQALMLMYMELRNKRDATTTNEEIHNDAGTVIATAAVSDNGTTFTKQKYA